MVTPSVKMSRFLVCCGLAGLLSTCGGGPVEKQDMAEVTGAKRPARAEAVTFLAPQAIGTPAGGQQAMITHLAVVDLDQNGLLDVIASDDSLERVVWVAQEPAGVFTEKVLGDTIKGPTHLSTADMDADGDLDILVASMGRVAPTSDEIGAVVVLVNDGQQNFHNEQLIGGVHRVTDVRAGDFDGDGDLDLVVGQLGYENGEIRWMENLGEGWTFRSHNLLNLSGTIRTPVVDIDQDGDLDIVALVTQEWEEVYVFENDGKAGFTPKMIYGSTNEDFGSSGLNLADLDGDGDLDVLFTNGDSFDYLPPGPRPWHGIQWLENKGGLEFTYHRLDDFAGAASAHAADIDGDGDLDIIATSSLGQDAFAEDASMIWFQNEGNMTFTRRDVVKKPALMLVMAPGDLDCDGKIDFVTGTYPSAPPVDLENRIIFWRNVWPGTAPAANEGTQP